VLPIASAVLGPGLLVVALAVVAPLSKWRPPLALLLAIAAVGLGLARGVLLPADGLGLPGLLGLGPETWGLLAWGAYGGLAAAAGGLWVPGPPALRAVLSGAMIGELGAAASLARSARTRDGAARLALAAAGGAMLGGVGDPALLALGERLGPHTWVLAPLSLLMVVVAWPTRALVHEARQGSRAVTVVSVAVAAGAVVWPGSVPALLALGALAMGALALRRGARVEERRAELLGSVMAPALWTFGSVVVVLVACAAGLSGVAAQGLEEVAVGLGVRLGPALGGLAALAAALVDGPAAGLFSTAVIDRGLELRGVDLGLSLGLGAAAGGLGPLVIAGGLRAGWWRWLLQVLAALAVVLLLAAG